MSVRPLGSQRRLCDRSRGPGADGGSESRSASHPAQLSRTGLTFRNTPRLGMGGDGRGRLILPLGLAASGGLTDERSECGCHTRGSEMDPSCVRPLGTQTGFDPICRGRLRVFASRSDWAFPADANAVLRAVKRAVATAGCQLQGADDRLLTVYFKSGRTNASASVSAKPDGSSLLTLQGATTALHHQISGEVGRMLTEASTHAERESPRAREADLVAADLDRLAALRRDGLLMEEEFAAAKDRVLASEVAEVESGSTEAEAPIVPKATPISQVV